jgi:hypothetical protein
MKSGFQTGNGLAQSNSPPSVTGGRRHQGKFQHPVKYVLDLGLERCLSNCG